MTNQLTLFSQPAEKRASLPLNIHFDSASAMATILDLHFPDGTILDVNWGLGVFYKKTDRRVVGLDLRPTGDLVADNRALPFAANSFSIGVCDPPYRRGGGDMKYSDRYGNPPRTTKKANQLYYNLLPELIRVCTDGLIIKAQDETDGHRFVCRFETLIRKMRELTGLEPHDVAYLIKHGVPENNRPGHERHFMANCVSHFLIYRWAQKSPFRPVRF